MPTFKWIVDCKDYEKQRIDRPTVSTIKKYFQGFNFGKCKRTPMYQDELSDLEVVYRGTLRDLHKQVEDCLPNLLHYMEEFLSLHKQNEAVREKLDALLAKTGKETSQENRREYE